MGVIGELLFSGLGDPRRPALSDLLRHYQQQKTQDLTKGLSSAKFAQLTEVEIVAEIAGWLDFDPLCIDREAATSDVRQAQVEVNNINGLSIKVQGLKITKTFPFFGNPQLFDLKPSRYSLHCPYGTVDGQKLTVGMEVREEEEAAAVAHIKSTIGLVESCISYQSAELEEHRAKLPELLLPLVQNRRRSALMEDDVKRQLDAI